MPEGSLQEAARRLVAAQDEAIERACERALQLGDRGVLIIDQEPDESTPTRITTRFLVGPHPSVPYGMIHRYPSIAAWLDAGGDQEALPGANWERTDRLDVESED